MRLRKKLPKMEANAMTEIVLIKEYIRPKSPHHSMENFEIQGEKGKIKIKDITKILERIDKWDSKREIDKKPRDSNKEEE